MSPAALGQGTVIAILIILFIRWVDSRIMRWHEEAERDAAEDADPILGATTRLSVAEWSTMEEEALAFARLKAEVRADEARKANHPSVLATDAEQVA